MAGCDTGPGPAAVDSDDDILELDLDALEATATAAVTGASSRRGSPATRKKACRQGNLSDSGSFHVVLDVEACGDSSASVSMSGGRQKKSARTAVSQGRLVRGHERRDISQRCAVVDSDDEIKVIGEEGSFVRYYFTCLTKFVMPIIARCDCF